jgi:diketogulonate reductase-like aldo/keto reductase
LALKQGYRHIDTAAAYANEAEIGQVLQEFFKSGELEREDVFVTTKVSCSKRVLI